ncbi:hypothetical protein [Metallosphaera javensis (ex Sakai et al. 2022)]|uniref:hypothetical protein n=1 Tax=Metallosphaera javensis (ex Sakai et al. 2022) TaxID=2775498 RepID=UPI00258BBD00|nr:MAG: hypothetical protein MjAS7_0143 [Metallosphaera javensis (ex Sakai et al. 2022)]
MGTDRKLFDDSYRFMKHYLKRAEKGFYKWPNGLPAEYPYHGPEGHSDTGEEEVESAHIGYYGPY